MNGGITCQGGAEVVMTKAMKVKQSCHKTRPIKSTSDNFDLTSSFNFKQ